MVSFKKVAVFPACQMSIFSFSFMTEPEGFLTSLTSDKGRIRTCNPVVLVLQVLFRLTYLLLNNMFAASTFRHLVNLPGSYPCSGLYGKPKLYFYKKCFGGLFLFKVYSVDVGQNVYYCHEAVEVPLILTITSRGKFKCPFDFN